MAARAWCAAGEVAHGGFHLGVAADVNPHFEVAVDRLTTGLAWLDYDD